MNIQQSRNRQNIAKTLKKNKTLCHGGDILERHIKIIKGLFCHSNYNNLVAFCAMLIVNGNSEVWVKLGPLTGGKVPEKFF